jgi:succinate dehydrogenase / fumarate reductase flavoprotein subunit
MHGSNRLGGNSLSDLLVFGRRAGVGASEYVRGLQSRPAIGDAELDRAIGYANTPFEGDGDENPYTLHAELQQMMNDLVGIIRDEDEMKQAIERLEVLKARAARVHVTGARNFNTGWHLALDLHNMLQVSEAVAKSALTRQESRGGHTRNDFPGMDANWRRVSVLSTFDGRNVSIEQEPNPLLPKELADLFEADELKKYFLPEELEQLGKGGH